MLLVCIARNGDYGHGLCGLVTKNRMSLSYIYQEWQRVNSSEIFAAHFTVRIGGSVVEFSPATRETGVRFPADACRFCTNMRHFSTD